MINCGIIGYGIMGQIRHETCDLIDRFNVVKIYDPNNKNIVSNSLLASSEQEIIENENIDVIFICTPNYLNKDLTIECIKNNKHVFCEKPPALKSKDVLEIQSYEKESSSILMYGFNHRHHQSIVACKKIISEKKYGDILWIRGRYGKSVDKSFLNNWRSDLNKSGGGILMDQGIHMLDLFLYFCDNFDIVKSLVSNSYWNSDIEDNVFALLRNSQDDISASLHSTMTQWRHLFSLEIFLESGYLVINGLNTSSGTYGEETLSIAQKRSTPPAATWKDEEKISFNDNFWETELLYFLDCINNKQKPKMCNSNDAFKILDLIERIYEDGK
ncbi:MAG: oxidoreductase [Legionellales bacterium]|mgnify:FL=1|nr:oxidoreductase [Legionellales bacterium]|tara:strand:+ start:1837 stop:2823 length:987 start_codon:yes stop_codon:yes gene_type:complete